MFEKIKSIMLSKAFYVMWKNKQTIKKLICRYTILKVKTEKECVTH